MRKIRKEKKKTIEKSKQQYIQNKQQQITHPLLTLVLCVETNALQGHNLAGLAVLGLVHNAVRALAELVQLDVLFHGRGVRWGCAVM